MIFADRTGVREIPPPITCYSAIQGEIIEQNLCDEGKWREGHIKYAANNFHLLIHFLARPSHNLNNEQRSIELNGFNMKMMEMLGENGEVPPAWYNLYAYTALVKAAALFGGRRMEEGYAALELAIDYCEKVALHKKGDILDTGYGEVLGSVKYEYQNGVIVLPDGSKEPVEYEYRMNFNASNLYYCITAPRGWEWFNSVRNEKRFKEYVDRAKKMANR